MARETISFEDLGKRFGSQKPKNTPPPKKSAPVKHFTPKNISTATATAPYNFVALPSQPLASEIDGVENFKKHILDNGTISGEIELEIETLTPLFLGGNGEESFAPAGTKIISGSTLRGMLKNIFKIVTCGTFRGRTDSQRKGEDFNDEHIYFRCLMGINSLAWTKPLNKLYNDRMVGVIRGKDGKLKPAKNARPGFLIQTKSGKYFIAPSIYEHDRKEDRIFIKEYQDTFHTTIALRNSSCVKWHGNTAYIITGGNNRLYDAKTYAKLTDDQKKKAGKQFIRFTKIDYVDWSREHWIELPDDVRESYEHDRNRRGVDLFKDKGILKRADVERLTGKNLPDVQTLIPCHFLYENNQVTAFGHGQCFRIPYKNSIGDVVPDALKSQTLIDFADAIFGYRENWSSRVAFEDAVPITEIKTLQTAAAHPLMQPNPTSYQIYLHQGEKDLNHWDTSNAILRGYKLYWHNKIWDWKATPAELDLDKDKPPEKRLTKNLTPLAKGITFKSKIRFQNLSAVELGALMMIFDLNGAKNPAYKIGMVKPLGFGSIKITPTLFIESADAYENIFDDNGWKNPHEQVDAATSLDAFKKHVDAQNMTATWLKVMDELNAILDWQNKPAPDKIKSMSGDTKNGVDERFKQRTPLPTIFEVLK